MKPFYKIFFSFIVLLALVSLSCNYFGSTDIQEYGGSAKFFAGEYSADIRASHSMLYGFIHAPLVALFGSLVVLKISSIFFLALISLSVYYISGKNKKAFLLMIASPALWYLGPWIGPTQIAGFLFLWAFFFMTKFEKNSKIKNLIYSGILAGLASGFWNTAIYISVILGIFFIWNKKFYHFIIFFLALIIGLLPLFIFEQAMFGFFFFSMAKTFSSNVIVALQGGIYQGINLNSNSFVDIFATLILIPFFSLILFQKKHFKRNKKAILFLLFAFLFLFLNPQIRYLIVLVPILTVLLANSLTKKQFKIQLIILLLLSLLTINPYLIQIKYSTNSPELTSLIENFGKWSIDESTTKIIVSDLNQISKDYPQEVFVVGPLIDSYAFLAFDYWGEDIKEFVSIEDYNLYIAGKQNIFEKRLESNSSIQNRRQIWLEGGMSRNPNDKTDFSSIHLAITNQTEIDLNGFQLAKEYQLLKVFEKNG